MASSNDFAPNYLGYYKEMVSKILSGSNELLIPSVERDSGEVWSSSISSSSASAYAPLFRGGLVTGISVAERERLKLYIDQSIKSLKCETDKILNQLLEKLDTDSDLECCSLINRMPSSSSFCPLHSSTALNSKYPPSFDQAQKNLEEFLDVIMSKCRPMTCGEKQQLGQRIRSLPKKALERVVEIIQYRHHTLKPMDEIDINLDEEDDVTLWRLYTYVEMVRNANKS